MKTRTRVYLLAIMAATAALSHPLHAQRPPTDLTTLRSTLERRFEILPLRDGVALRPREAYGDIRSIEITSGVIAIDGQAVTGAELRQRLGADADGIIELSYLSESDRRDLVTTGERESRPDTRTRREDIDRRVAERISRRFRGNRDNDRVKIGGSQTVKEGEVVDGDVVTIGGSVTIDGEVHGDAVAIGGKMTLGPHAYITQDAVAVGAGLDRDPGARVDGKVTEVGLGNFDFGDINWRVAPWAIVGSTMGSVVDFVGTFTRFAILCLLCALVMLLGRQVVERTADYVSRDLLKAGAIGFLAEMLFIPVLVITIVVLVITIIGIPLILLLPFAIIGLMVVALIGFTSVTYRLGGVVGLRMGWGVGNPYATTMLGILVVMAPILLARLIGLAGGFLFPMTAGLWIVARLVEWVAWTVGLGAVALARFNRSSSSMTPAMPS